MKLILHKIYRHKGRYIIFTLALVVINLLVFVLLSSSLVLSQLYYPECVFKPENTFFCRIVKHEGPLHQTISAFNLEQINKLSEIKGIRNACNADPRFLLSKINDYELENLNDTIKNVFFRSLEEGFEKILPVQLIKGNFIKGQYLGNNIMITRSLAEKLKIMHRELPVEVKFSDKLRYPGIRKVCGIIENLNYKNSEGEEVHLVIVNGSFTSMCCIQTDGTLLINDIRRIIKGLGIQNDPDFEIELTASTEIIRLEWNENKKRVLSILGIIPVMLFYSFIAIFGLFWNEVAQCKREYGLLKALGINRIQLVGLVLKEALLLSFISIVLSTLILINIIRLFMGNIDKYKSMVYGLTFGQLICISSFIFVAGVLLAACIPAIKTMLINPVEALSEE